MNDYLPRTEPVASVLGAKERSLANVSGTHAASPGEAQTDAIAQQDAQLTERSAVTASYARLQADIANVIAKLDPPRPNAGPQAAAADQALMQFMPQPVIVLPLPPTDQKMVEFVAQVAQSLAQQAAMARAAQARMSPAVVGAAIQ